MKKKSIQFSIHVSYQILVVMLFVEEGVLRDLSQCGRKISSAFPAVAKNELGKK